MPFQIFNTLTRKKEDFVPADPKNVRFYVCGPTVYNAAHIGNLYAYVSADLMVRALRAHGYGVNAVMNLTDVDDKTIRGTVAQAAATGGKATVDGLRRYTQTYADVFLNDLRKLGCDRFNVVRRVTEVMPEMVAITQKLLDRGAAYLAPDGSVYCSVAKAEGYGELAHLDFSGMKAGARVDNDEYAKDAAADFALWKAHDPATDGDIFWDAEFTVDGRKKTVRGRPGWHVECSAMNWAQHGEQIDLHMGGIDLIFPHHQNEIAQSEGAFGKGADGKGFCRHWAHSGHVMESGKKMAKRDGGFVTLKTMEDRTEIYSKNASFALQKAQTESANLAAAEIKKTHRAFRMMCAQSHYRQGFDFSWEKFDGAINTIRTIDNVLKLLSAIGGTGAARVEFQEKIAGRLAKFMERVADDLDTPGAFAEMFGLTSEVNLSISYGELTSGDRETAEKAFRKIAEVLPVFDFSLLEESVPADVAELVTAVMAAKAAKDWPAVDALRAQALAKGWKIVDQKDRTSRAERA